jgi:phosphate-selective porin OprO/OprP
MSTIAKVGVLLLAVLMMSATPPAMAANETILELIRVLRDSGTINQETYELLRKSAVAEAESSAALPVRQESAAGVREAVRQEVQTVVKDELKAATAGIPKIETKDKMKITSSDDDFEWQFIGRVLADYNLINSDKTKLGSGAEIRRARLGMEGKSWQHWIWKVEADFANEEVALKDAWVGYESGDSWVRLGHHHVPFGLSTMASSKYMLFIERPLLADNVLQPTRRIGASAFNHWGERATLQAGVFAGTDGEDPDGCLAGFDECDEQLSIAARGTWNPYFVDAKHLMHLGAAVWYLDPQDSDLKVEQRPGVFHVVDSKFESVKFGPNAVDNVMAFNLESAAVWGPFVLQAEYTNWNVSRQRPAGTAITAPKPDDADFDGWYVEAAYFITGESMNFKAGEALYGGVKPNGIVGKGGIGAWQLAVRYDSMDLNDMGAGLIGGEQDALSLGLTWYATNTLRFQANYVTVLEMTRPGDAHDGDEPDAVLFRSQVYW